MPERRKLPRPKSLLTVIEDITYTVLRAHSASSRNPDRPNEPEQLTNVLNENRSALMERDPAKTERAVTHPRGERDYCGSRRSHLQRRRHCICACGQRCTGKRFWHGKDNRSDMRQC